MISVSVQYYIILHHITSYYIILHHTCDTDLCTLQHTTVYFQYMYFYHMSAQERIRTSGLSKSV